MCLELTSGNIYDQEIVAGFSLYLDFKLLCINNFKAVNYIQNFLRIDIRYNL